MKSFQRKRCSAYTLIEVMIGLGASSMLMAGMASTLFLAGQSLDHGGAAATQTKRARDLLDDIAMDIEHATQVTERTTSAVTVQVPDRDGDGNDETIRYSWSGTSGAPLQMTYNNGTAATLADNVRSLSFSYLTRPVTGIGFAKGFYDDSRFVAYWRFEEGAGMTAKDITNYANDGTLAGGTVWATGYVGGALRFDGSDDYVNVPYNSSLSLTSGMTITAWVYLTDRTGARVIVNKGTSDTSTNYRLAIENGKLAVSFYASGWWRLTSPNLLSVQRWYFVCARMTPSGSNRVFVLMEDGVQSNTATAATAPLANTQALQIGGLSASGSNFSGCLDDVRIYNSALAADQIIEIRDGKR